MAKREVPVFVIDRNRDHGLGEVDFIVCTDIDNGFVAICEYVENVPDEMTDTSITQKGGGVNPRLSLRISIKRNIGKNPTVSATRTLLRKAMKVYTTDAYVSVKEDSTVEDCIRFLDIMIKSISTTCRSVELIMNHGKRCCPRCSCWRKQRVIWIR